MDCKSKSQVQTWKAFKISLAFHNTGTLYLLCLPISIISCPIIILMPGIDYHINFNHGKPFIIITFVIKCAIPSIL